MLTERERAERQVQEKAQGLVARGQLEAAVRLLDGFLARCDGDWGIWLYFGHLCVRLGWSPQAVAAFRASARQLEGDGHLERARNVLLEAVKVDPRDASLARDVQRLTRMLPQDPAEMTCMMPAVSVPSPPRGAGGKATVLARRSPPVARALAAMAPPSVVVDATCLLDPVREAQPSPRPSPSLDLTPRRGPDPFSLLAPAPLSLRPVRQSPPRPPDARHQRTAVVPRRGQAAVTDPHLAIFDILDAEAEARRQSSQDL